MMLKFLRNKKTAKKVWIGLAIIIVPAFVLWGSGSLMGDKEKAVNAGRIFGKKVSALEYKDALAAARTAAIMQFGDNFEQMQKFLNLEVQAWERLILLYEAKKRKVDATDKEVIELIEKYPFFQRNGQFDNRTYSENLRYYFHTEPRVFEEQTRQNIILAKLFNQVTEKIQISEEEIKKEYQKANEEISLDYIAGLPANFTKDIAPSEQEIKEYFTKNSLQFKQPLSFNMDYLGIDTETKTREAALRLNKKESLEKVAKDLGLDLKETGLFTQSDPIPGIGWSPKIAELVAQLKIGQFTPPIQTDKNYYILRLKERKEAYVPEFDKVKDRVRETLVKEKAGEIAKAKIQECLRKLKDAAQQAPEKADFNSIAAECGLKSDATALFKFGSYIEGIGSSDIFWTTAAGLKENTFSDIIETPSGFYIIKLKSRVSIDEKKFSAEKTEFTQRSLAQKKQEYFADFLEELKRKAQQ